MLSAWKESKMLCWRDTCVTLVNGTLVVSRFLARGKLPFPELSSAEHMGKTRPFHQKLWHWPIAHQAAACMFLL